MLFWPENIPSEWIEFSWFDTQARYSFLTVCISSAGWTICTNGSDLMAIQRYLATQNLSQARKCYAISIVAGVLVGLLIAWTGLGLLGFYTLTPSDIPPGETIASSADSLFPLFIVRVLPAGVTGIVLAGLLAAAMSSLSSGVNSASLAVTRDLFGSLSRKNLSQKQQLQIAIATSFLIGAVIVVLSFVISNVRGNLIEVINKTCNLFVAPLFVPFFMAMFIRVGTNRGTVLGTFFSIVAAVLVGYSEEIFGSSNKIPFILIIPISFLTGAVSSTIFSWLDRIFLRRY